MLVALHGVFDQRKNVERRKIRRRMSAEEAIEVVPGELVEHDFTAERYRGTARETLSGPPDEWGGRAAVEWARRLAARELFDPEAARLVEVARALDAVYGR